MLKKFLYFAPILLLLACSDNKVPTQNVDSFKHLINFHTGNNTSIISPIKIKFAQDIVKNKNTSVPLDFFTISPKVNGELNWKTNNTLQFTPKSPLHNNTKYFVELDLNKIYSGLADSLQTFSFDFRTRHQHINLREPYLTTINDSVYRLQGSIKTAGFIDFKTLQNSIKANINSEDLKFTLGKISKNKYEYSINHIERQTKRQTLHLALNLDDNNIKISKSKDITIRALGDFHFLRGHLTNNSSVQEIRLTFSDYLKEGQSLEGLIYTNKGNFDLITLNNTVIISFKEQISGEVKITIEKRNT